MRRITANLDELKQCYKDEWTNIPLNECVLLKVELQATDSGSLLMVFFHYIVQYDMVRLSTAASPHKGGL